MNSPAKVSGCELYVHLNPGIAAQLQRIAPSLDSTEDVHICGGCKQSFTDIKLFVEHKHAGCAGSSQNTVSVMDVSLENPNLSCSASTQDSTISNTASQYLRVILSGSNVPLHLQEQSSLCEQESLQSLLGLPYKKADVIPNQHGSNVESCGIQNSVIQLLKKGSKSEKDKRTVHRETLSNNETVSVSAAAVSCHEQDPLMNLDIEKNNFIVGEKETAELESTEMQQNNSEAIGPASSNGSIDEISKNYHDNYVDKATNDSEKLINQSDTLCTKRNDYQENQHESSIIFHDGTEDVFVEDYQSLPENNMNNTLSAPSAYSDRTKKKHMCPIPNCKFITPYPKDVVRHMRKHTGERPFQCESCQRTYSRIDKLRAHQYIHFGEKCHKCQVCNYATVDKGSLKKHMRVHNDERPFKCQICPYRSKRSCHLTVHLRTHTGDHPFVCLYESCMSAFKTSSDLKRHIRMHTGERPYACDICDYRCSIKSNLGVHIRINHATENLIPCTICNHVSVSEGAAREHAKIHSGDSQLVTTDCLPEKKDSTTRKNLGGNIRRRKHQNSKPYKILKGKDACKETGSERTRSSNAIKPYCVKAHNCTLCDAAFVREDSWRSHMRQHQNQGAYVGTITDSETLASVHSIAKENAKNCSAGTELVSSRSAPATSNQTQAAVAVLESNVECSEITLTSDGIVAADTETLMDSKVIVANESSMALQETRNHCNASFTSTLQDKTASNEHVEEVEMHSVLGNDALKTEPVFLYVRNGVLEESTINEDFHNTGVLTSLNQSSSVLLTGRCGQYLSVPSNQNALVEQMTPSLHTEVEYVLSAPMDSFADAEDTCLKASSAATKENF